MDLGEAADRKVGTYSGGMRKRLDLACALVHRPRVLFLDEPTTGLDPQSRTGLWSYLERLNKEEELTIFLTTHYMEEADRLCDRLAIIDDGKLIVEGAPSDLKAGLGGDVVSLSFKSNGESAEAQVGKARQLATGQEYVRDTTVSFEADGTGTLAVVVENGSESVPLFVRLLDEAGLRAAGLNLTRPTLDDVFLKYTGTRIRTDDPVPYSGGGPFARRRRRA